MIQEASIVGLLNTILVIILIYYVLKILGRIFGPMLMRYAANKVEQKFSEQFQKSQQAQEPQNQKQSKNSKTDNLGEYIDYEEID